MTKAEIIAELAETAGITKAETERVLDGIFDPDIGILAREMTRGETVKFIGFGSFASVFRQARNGRNPRTGEQIKIPESHAVKFSAARALTETLNPVSKVGGRQRQA